MFKTFWITTLLVLFTSLPTATAAQSATTTLTPLESLGFFPTAALENVTGFAEVVPAMNATFSFPVDPAGNGSAFFVSTDGHFMTNIHVVKNCLVDQEFIYRLDNYDYERTSKKYPAHCVVARADGSRFEFDILASGLGFTQSGHAIMNQDFVLGKISVRKPTPCLQVRWERPPTAEIIHLVGYPMRSENRASNSDGQQQQVSSGRIMDPAQYKECPVIEPEYQSHVFGQRKFVKGQREKPRRFDQMISVSADLLPGNSGGPGVDRSGRVIGIADSISADVQNAKSYCPGGEYLIPMDTVLQTLSEQIDPDAMVLAFNCSSPGMNM